MLFASALAYSRWNSAEARPVTTPLFSGGGSSPDPAAARAALLNELSLWLSDSLLMAKRVVEGHFGIAAAKSPAPHELDAIVRTGTALFQTAAMIQAQQQAVQQAVQHASSQAAAFEPPPELRKAIQEMMKKAPKLLEEMMREANEMHEGESWKRGADEKGDDEPPSPPRRRRHPEDEPEGEA